MWVGEKRHTLGGKERHTFGGCRFRKLISIINIIRQALGGCKIKDIDGENATPLWVERG